MLNFDAIKLCATKGFGCFFTLILCSTTNTYSKLKPGFYFSTRTYFYFAKEAYQFIKICHSSMNHVNHEVHELE
jgi:hypothetical protein